MFLELIVIGVGVEVGGDSVVFIGKNGWFFLGGRNWKRILRGGGVKVRC